MKMRVGIPLLVSMIVYPCVLMAAQPPIEMMFSNNDQLKISLSNTDLNKVLISGDRIVSVDGVRGSYSAKDTADGGILVAPAMTTRADGRTLYVETEFGRAVSLKFTATPTPGKTYELHPMSPPKVVNDLPKAWEEEGPYLSVITDLFGAVLAGGIPENYIEVAVDAQQSQPSKQPYLPFKITRERIFVGFHLAITEYRVENQSQLTLDLPAENFYMPGVRAAAASAKALAGHGVAKLWLVTKTEDTEGLANK